MSVELISNDLKEYVSRKVNKDISELNEEDLSQIKKVIFRSKNIFDTETDYNLKDLEKLQNIMDCTIFLFPITDEELDIINKSNKIQFISFDNCEIKTENLKFNKNIENLFMDNCKFVENIEITGEGLKDIKILGYHEKEVNIDISNFKNLESLENLEIHYYNIIGLDSILNKAPNLKSINIDGSKVENIEEIIDKLKGKVEISNEKHYMLS